LQEETSEIKQSIGEQCSKVDEAVGQVGETLESLKEREKERDEEIKNMREEVDTLKTLIERVSRTSAYRHHTCRFSLIVLLW
jgi:peroxin-14